MFRSISTRMGDDGTTGLLHGRRLPKDHPQIEAMGSLDEFNAALGLAKAEARDAGRKAALELVQRDLIALMGEISSADAGAPGNAAAQFPTIGEADLARIDADIAVIEAKHAAPRGWATPGATREAAALDFARTVARRAERRLVALSNRGQPIRPLLLKYMNRVSDLLWLMAREAESTPA